MGKQIDKIRVSAGEDLLAFIPHMLGYWPERSIVCIGMSGKRLRATMRLDLPPEDMSDPAGFAAIAASQLAGDDLADGCLIAIFGAVDWDSPLTPPHAGLLRELRAAFASHRLPVRDAWYIGPDHWRSLECREAGCCPWPGKDNASIRESFVNAEFIYRGSMVRESPQRQIENIVAVRDKAFAGKVRTAGDPMRGRLATDGTGAHQLAVTLGAWEMALQQWPKTPDASLAAFLLASLAQKQVRDAVIVALATGPDAALAGAAGTGCLRPDTENVLVPPDAFGANMAAGFEAGITDVSDEAIMKACLDFTNIIVGEVANPYNAELVGPNWDRLEQAEPLLRFLVAATDGEDKAPVLCLLGWIEWCKGRGTWAGNYFQLSQQHQPGYRLASLLEQLLGAGHIAACAKDRRTAWHGSRDEAPDAQDHAA